MSLLTKIRRSKDDQLERENAGRVNPLDTSFFPWVKQQIGRLNLLVNRKFYEPNNVLQWTMPVLGNAESNITINATEYYGLKFDTEILRGDLACSYKIGIYDTWSFFAGVAGAYRVGIVFKLVFYDDATAQEYFLVNSQLEEPKLTLSINGTWLTHPIAWNEGLLEDGLTLKVRHYLTGTQNIWLNAGDRLNIYFNMHGKASPVPLVFTTFGHISINFLTKKTRIINSQTV